MTRPARFREADATRALRAAMKAGLTPSECTIGPDGAIRLVFGDPAAATLANPLDRLLSR